jgi:HNH endonuclease
VCEECGRGTRDGAGRAIEIEPHEVEAACCDAQNIGSIAHVDGPLERATQTIPPRIRRWVVRRDHGRCRVDGCRSAKYLEMHHVVPRAEGGTHDPSGLALLCDAHHRQIHAGVLSVTGNANERLEFRRADGTRVGEPGRARVASSRPAATRDSTSRDSANVADAIDALRRLDVPAKYARDAVAAAAEAGAEELESLLRHAFQFLGRTIYARTRTSSPARERARPYQPRRVNAPAPGAVAGAL